MKFDLAASAMSASTILAAFTAPAGTSAVNFVIIQPDDMVFYDDWSPPPFLPWGGKYPGTSYPDDSGLPWINKLREEGLEMTQAYAAAPKCGTSRYSTVTGRYASRSSHGRKIAGADGANPADVSIPNTKLRDVGTHHVVDGMDCSVGNVAQVFKANNYTTGMVGKWHLTKIGNVGDSVAEVRAEVESCGFMDVAAMYPDNFAGDETTGWAAGIDHNMEYVAYKAVEFIEANNNSDWFLYVNPTVPHGPSVSAAMAKDCRVTTDGDFSGSMISGWSVDGMTKEFGDDCMLYREDVKARASQSSANDNLGAIWVDDAIGAIYKSLERTGQLSNTFVLFQLDHGKVKKDKIWEGGLRIPQFIHYPAGLGSSYPRTFDGMVSTIDIGPTMLDFAGITPSSPGWYDMDGKSWKDAIDNLDGFGDDWKENRCLFFESSEERAVRCGCDKYVLLSEMSPEAAEAAANGWWTGHEGLFDLCDNSNTYIVAATSTSSPEATNLLASEPLKALDLRALLDCHLDRTDASLAPKYEDCFGDIATPTPTMTTTPEPTLPVANNGGAPEYIDSSPWQNDILTSDVSTVISATVLDDNIRKVRINIRLPDGTRTGFTAANEVSTSGHQSTHQLPFDTTGQSGKYGYRLQIQDFSDNDLFYPSEDGWVDFLVINDKAELVAAARAEIASIIQDALPEVNLASKFVRHGFHDCVGGCDGCVDMTNPDNAGLDVPIAALEPVVEMFTHFGMTRADIWVLAALQGASGSQPIGGPDNREFSMDWIGRANCENIHLAAGCVDNSCNQIRGPHRDLPSPNLNTHDLLTYFNTVFGFNERDTVAIMGAHTLGTLARENSGYDGLHGWLGNTLQLSNGYYDTLVGGQNASSPDDELIDGGNWEQVYVNNSAIGTPNRFEWERGTNPHFVMINSDIALVRDLTGKIEAEGKATCQFKCQRRNCPLEACPHAPRTLHIAARYKFDNAEWLEDFESAFQRMLQTGQQTGVCQSPPCTVGSTARRSLRVSTEVKN